VRVLFFGDVVGSRAAEWLAALLPELRLQHGVDLVVVDAENAGEDGECMSVATVEALLAGGADVVTGGNHAFDGNEVEAVLAHERVLRPLNVAAGVPGRGAITLEAAGEEVRVVVLADRLALDWAPEYAHMAVEPYAAFAALPPGPPTTIIEMHALSVMAKQGLAYALDGTVAAVLGTHTHEPTLPLHLLPGGTALVTDVGMNGPAGGPQGMRADAVAAYVRDPAAGRPGPPGPAGGDFVLAAILLEIENGLTRSLRRL
jgi:calcineurin-like phosphoesterase